MPFINETDWVDDATFSDMIKDTMNQVADVLNGDEGHVGVEGPVGFTPPSGASDPGEVKFGDSKIPYLSTSYDSFSGQIISKSDKGNESLDSKLKSVFDKSYDKNGNLNSEDPVDSSELDDLATELNIIQQQLLHEKAKRNPYYFPENMNPTVGKSGLKLWLKNNCNMDSTLMENMHRMDGPAMIKIDGSCYYFILGREYIEQAYWEEVARLNSYGKIEKVYGDLEI